MNPYVAYQALLRSLSSIQRTALAEPLSLIGSALEHQAPEKPGDFWKDPVRRQNAERKMCAAANKRRTHFVLVWSAARRIHVATSFDDLCEIVPAAHVTPLMGRPPAEPYVTLSDVAGRYANRLRGTRTLRSDAVVVFAHRGPPDAQILNDFRDMACAGRLHTGNEVV